MAENSNSRKPLKGFLVTAHVDKSLLFHRDVKVLALALRPNFAALALTSMALVLELGLVFGLGLGMGGVDKEKK